MALDLYNNNSATDEDIKIGDMDNDGVINSNDAAAILDVYNAGNQYKDIIINLTEDKYEN